MAVLSKFSTLAPDAVVDTLWLNAALGGEVMLNGKLDTVISFVVEDGRISRMYAVRNPRKLSRLGQKAALAR